MLSSNHRSYTHLHDVIAPYIITENEQEQFFLDATFAPFVLLPYLVNNYIDLPIWIMGVAPPSSGKTKRISLFDSLPNVFRLSTLTGNALMSGYRDDTNKDPSILPMLDKKVLVIKDMTPIYQQNKDVRDSIMGQLRDIYDGTSAKATGVTGIVEYSAKFNMLAMITQIFDSFYSVSSILGERFIPVRLLTKDTTNIASDAIDNILSGKKKTHNKIATTVTTHIKELTYISLADIDIQPYKKVILDLTRLVCAMRTHVTRDSTGSDIVTIPQIESNARLAAQITLITAAYLLHTGCTDIKKIKRYIAYICRCSVPLIRLHIIHLLYRLYEKDSNKTIPFEVIRYKAGINRNLLRQILDDFRLVGLVYAEQNNLRRNRVEYQLVKGTYTTCRHYGFFEGHSWKAIQPNLITANEEDLYN